MANRFSFIWAKRLSIEFWHADCAGFRAEAERFIMLFRCRVLFILLCEAPSEAWGMWLYRRLCA